MEARELRIGNWVSAIDKNGNKVQFQVDFIAPYREYDPIPLTPEILEKAGFKKFGKYAFTKGSFIIHNRKRGFVINKRYITTLYVHQLQNLYFALTGTELNIDLANL